MFYDRYVLLCKDAGVSTSAAAVQAGINKGTVSVWKKKREQGIDVDPDRATIEKLCAFFNISEVELRGVSDHRAKKSPAVSSEAVTPKKQELLSLIDSLSDDQLSRLLPIIEEAKKLL